MPSVEKTVNFQNLSRNKSESFWILWKEKSPDRSGNLSRYIHLPIFTVYIYGGVSTAYMVYDLYDIWDG